MPSSSTTAATATRGRPGYAREDVIQIAVEEFNARGYEATSMGTLAERLGLSKSAIYHHISSKEEILVEATDKALAELNTYGAIIGKAYYIGAIDLAEAIEVAK